MQTSTFITLIAIYIIFELILHISIYHINDNDWDIIIYKRRKFKPLYDDIRNLWLNDPTNTNDLNTLYWNFHEIVYYVNCNLIITLVNLCLSIITVIAIPIWSIFSKMSFTIPRYLPISQVVIITAIIFGIVLLGNILVTLILMVKANNMLNITQTKFKPIKDKYAKN